MENSIHVIAAILATGRLTEIITVERVSAWFRTRWPLYIWTCPRCVSVWAGLLCGILYLVYPYANWPFALSALFILQAQLVARLSRGIVVPDEPNVRRLIITSDAQGNVAVRHSEFTATDLAMLVTHVSQTLSPAPPSKRRYG